MAKTIVKEIIISLLICLAIILVLGIVFYEYVPISKTIPNDVNYSTPPEAKSELANNSGVNEDDIIMTYEVDATDLSNYARINNYKPGKANPFSSFETQSTNGNANNSGSSTGNTNNNSNTNSNANTGSNTETSSNTNSNTKTNTTTSGGQYFQDKGTK